MEKAEEVLSLAGAEEALELAGAEEALELAAAVLFAAAFVNHFWTTSLLQDVG